MPNYQYLPAAVNKGIGMANHNFADPKKGGGADEILGKLFSFATSANPYMSALSFIPGAMSMISGLFGKNKTSPATRVNQSSVHLMDTTYNANPVLAANQTAQNTYNQAIGRSSVGGNAVANYGKALSSTLEANNQTYGTKFNMERQMRSDKASLKGRLDITQAQLDESWRRDHDMTEGNLGWDGNFAQQGYRSIADAGLIDYRDRRRSAMDIFSAAFGAKAIAGNSGIDDRNMAWLKDELDKLNV